MPSASTAAIQESPEETASLDIETLEVFEPLLGDEKYKGAYGGRASGKSHFFAELVVERCIQHPGTRVVCVREVQKDLKESAKLLIADKIRQFGARGFRVLESEIKAPGGGLIIFRGMNNYSAESIKSLEGFDVAWVEEAHTLTERSLEMLRPTIRKDGSQLWFSWNPRSADDPVDKFFRGEVPPPDSVCVKVNYVDNKWFPASAEVDRAFDEINNPGRYAHIWLGEYEPQAIGAIWDRRTIERTRRSEAPKMSRVLVAIDPPISSEPGSDEAGIVVVGLGEDGEGYVLDDLSAVGTPQEWAEKAVAGYDLYDADAIVAEVNQGGDMVTHVIRSVRPNLRVIEVRATRGKHVRAEPISALYTLDKMHHVGAFPKLEAQMCLMTAAGYEGNGSPDHVDAMVWGATELFPKMTRKTRNPNRPLPTRANSRYNAHRPWA